jgi:hypothetical protein
MVHEVVRAEEFAERGLRVTAPIMPGSRSKSTARGTYFQPKAEVLAAAAAADAVLVGRTTPPKLCALRLPHGLLKK